MPAHTQPHDTVSTPAEDHLGWVIEAARAADAKVGENTLVLDVGEVLGITDHFVITSGQNPRQVRAIVEEIERQVRAAGGPDPRRIEGTDEWQWVLMDYGAFVVHVFEDEARRYYDLERLWADCERVEWAHPS